MTDPGATDATRPRVVQLADRLADEIRVRRLRPGARFLTAAEAARTLRVSMTLANRALQLLAQRGVIERRQRIGAIVAAPRAGDSAALARVGVFAPAADVAQEGLLEDGVIVGLQRALPGCAITFHATGSDRDVDALEGMLRDLGRAPEPVGVVLVRSSLAAQRLAVRSGLPTVVFGTRRPSIRALDAVDRDHASAGRQLADAVAGSAARHLLTLLNERVLPGDQLFLDGVVEAARAATRLRVHARFCPADDAAVAALVEEHLAWVADRRVRVAIVCRNLPLAHAARRCLDAAGRRFAIGVADVYGTRGGAGFVVAVPTEGPERQGELLGEMLARRVADLAAPPRQHLIEVRVAR
ncbi:MAG: GntR family transcriptional regulator [Planctomycetes bacterium]|nr:GntR family transcriptional regulator [Planctomycetota bacterium]